MKSAKFVPSAAATDYASVQDEAVAFYRAQKSRDERSDGQVSRLAATAAKRWEKSLQRPADVVDFSVDSQNEADRVGEILRGQGYAAGGVSFDGRSWLVRTNAPEATFDEARKVYASSCIRCHAPLGASQYTPNGADMPTFCSFECYADGRNEKAKA